MSANPNTKIVIKEVDNTKPKGSGASSDIVYVPGLAIDSARSKNEPVLCYTVADFEYAFGSTPYIMKSNDISSVSVAHTYEEGSFDRSYIYAKELIQAGMPVYYENICPPDGAPVNIAEVNAIGLTEDSHLLVKGINNYTYIACKDRKDQADTYTFKFFLPAPTDATNPNYNLTYGKAYVHLDIPTVDKVKITPTAVTAKNDDTTTFTLEKVSGTSDYIISWQNAEATAFVYTSFEFSIEFLYSGKEYEVEVPVTFAVIEGAKLEGEPVMGRIDYLYENVANAFERLQDKNEYTVKFITSGGYPTFDVGGTLYTTMLTTAGTRGDAVALIDHLDIPSAPHGTNKPDSIYSKVINANLANAANAEYGAMFTPWGKYSFSTITDNEDHPAFMPASYGYLMCYAAAIKNSPNWLAMAGVTRGAVPNLQYLHTDTILSNVVAEDYQPKYGTSGIASINCITNIRPYGLVIWGNRTLDAMAEKGAKALNFLNTRNMCSDIKKVAYSTAKALMFEQESDTLWLRFKSMVSPLLDQLKSGYGISDYKLIKGTTKYDGSALTRGEMAVVIRIFPIAPIEYFEITVELTDDDVVVS